jgi:hypothetical protein
MSDTVSLLLATSILSIGGLAFYFYKSTEDEPSEENQANENTILENELDIEDYEEKKYIKPKTNAKTKRNTKNRRSLSMSNRGKKYY